MRFWLQYNNMLLHVQNLFSPLRSWSNNAAFASLEFQVFRVLGKLMKVQSLLKLVLAIHPLLIEG